MEQPWENFDNVILASPMLKSRRINDNGTTIELIYTDFPDAGADSALQCCHNALKFFRRLYKIAGDEGYLHEIPAFSFRHLRRVQP